MLPEIPSHVTLVAIDFDHESLQDVLQIHRFAGDLPTFYIWEGVTQYLNEAGVRATFESLAGTPVGSRLVFTYVRKDFIDGRVLYGHEYLRKRMAIKNNVWLFGMEPEQVSAFIAPYGWRVLEHLGHEDIADHFVKPTGRTLLTTPIERMVYAEKE